MMRRRWRLLVAIACLWTAFMGPGDSFAQEPAPVLETGEFRWRVAPPIVSIATAKLPDSPEHPWVAIKDPSIVRYDDRWHLFCTLRKNKTGSGRIRIGYCSFADWSEVANAKWSALTLTSDYHGAPQIFYFQPQQTWYLIYQAADESRQLAYGPCYSTNKNITDPSGWTLPEPLYTVPEGEKAGLDFWVICDQQRAYLFFTSLDGKFWRAATRLDQFPSAGWSKPVVAYHGDIFEASHTYFVPESGKYLTFVEAQGDRKRYFKALVADRLDGTWTELAATSDKPFVSPRNVVNQDKSWATSYSHGELLRSGFDQRLEIDLDDLTLLFQGANDHDYQGNDYGVIPWQLGLLSRQKP